MATRIQNKILGLGLDAQVDIETASTNYLRFRQLNAEIAPTAFTTETDAAEVGKGNEFATQVYPVAWSAAARIDKYASAEFMTWAFGFGMGNVSETTGTYTIKPIDPCVTLELPYFSVVEQICEGGGQALDNAFLGCSVEDVLYEFNYGPGRQSGRCTVNWVGSGRMTTPSGVTLPPLVSENYLLASSMTLTIGTTDYITAKTMLSGSIGWKNNMLLGPGYYPGSGVQDNAAVRGRQEIGARACTFTFTARLLKNSDEYAKLKSQISEHAVLKVQFDSTHWVNFDFPAVKFETVVNGEQDGIVSVTCTLATIWDTTAGTVLTVTSQCGVAGIAQSTGAKKEESGEKAA